MRAFILLHPHVTHLKKDDLVALEHAFHRWIKSWSMQRQHGRKGVSLGMLKANNTLNSVVERHSGSVEAMFPYRFDAC